MFMFPKAVDLYQLTADNMAVRVNQLVDVHGAALVKCIETAAINGSFSCTYNLPVADFSSDDVYREVEWAIITKLRNSGYKTSIAHISPFSLTCLSVITIDWSGKQLQPPPKKP